MNDGWYETTVSEIVSPEKYSCVGGPFGSNLTRKDYVVRGVPVSRGSNLDISSQRFIDDDFVYVSEKKANKLIQNTAYPGDLIFTQRGTIGQVAIIPNDAKYPRYILSQNQMKLTPNPAKADTRFLYYLFVSPRSQELIQRGSIGSTIPGFNLTQLRAFPLLIPPLDEQRAIAEILGSLDDKIEANRRMNDTLEATARAIFKSWFVDFDPVHAKANGDNPTGMDAETAALFPDSFEDSELGLIPSGWRVLAVSEFLKINPSRTLKKNVVAPYLSMSNVPTFSMRPDTWEYREFSSGTRFTNGDVLMARITPSLENGKTVYVDFLNQDEVGWGSTEYIVLRSPHGYPSEYAYFIVRDPTFRDYAIANMTGTSGRQRVPTDCLDHYLIVVPPQSVATLWGNVVETMSHQMKLLTEQITTLAETRDALLPKLVSGELRIGEMK
ncbi:MAG: restriction endonuclease subunit S [Aggregatilineales bacterium]